MDASGLGLFARLTVMYILQEACRKVAINSCDDAQGRLPSGSHAADTIVVTGSKCWLIYKRRH
jgi:hypothetical protein